MLANRGGALRLLLQFIRAQESGDAYGFRFGPQEYILPTASGDSPSARFDWTQEVLADLQSVGTTPCQHVRRSRRRVRPVCYDAPMCNFLHPGWLDPLYKPHFVCFDCRKHFKLRDENVERFWRAYHELAATPLVPDRDQVGAHCPDCSAVMVPVCACFKPPRKTQVKRWNTLREQYRGRRSAEPAAVR